MQKHNVLGMILAGGALLSAAGNSFAAPNIVHQPPLEAKVGRSLAINATVTDSVSPIAQVKLYYRTTGALGYQFELMAGTGYNFSGTIPANAVGSAGVDYYLEAMNRAGEISTAPLMGASLAPYHLVAREAAGAPGLRLLMPADGAVLAPDEATVAVVVIESGAGRPDLSTLRIIFDEKDVTAKCRATATLVTYALPGDLAEGLHGLRVHLRNADGVEAKSPTWSFTIRRPGTPTPVPTAAPETAFRCHGGVSAESQYAAMTRDSDQVVYTSQPRGWLNRLNLNFNGKAGALNFLGTAFLTSEEQPGRQPVDRARLELFDPTFNLALGDLYPVFSPYSLDNCFVRGGGLTLMSGPADESRALFEMAGGLTRIAIPGRDVTVPGTYEQWLWAGRWRYDFLPGTGFGLNAVTVNDFRNSLPSGQTGGSLPAANAALTGEGSAKVFWSRDFRTLLYAEYGLSYYDEQMSLVSFALAPAWRGGMRWDWGGRSYLKLEYDDTGAKYVSLASPWLVGDWRGLSGDAQIFLIDNSLILTAAGNYWRDNLDGQKDPQVAGDSLTASGTTTTLFLSGALNCRPAAWLPTLSLGYSLNRQTNDIAPAPTVDNQTGVLNLGAGVQIPVGSDQWLGNVSYSQTRFQALVTPKLVPDVSSSSFLFSLMYLLGTAWNFSAGFGLTGTETNYDGSLSAGASQKVDYTLGNARANWKAVPGTLDLGGGWETLCGRDNGNSVDNSLTTLTLQSTYYFSPAQSLAMALSNINYDDRVMSVKSYAQFVVNLRYGMSF